MTDKRPMRVCDVCGQIDDHPRAVHAFGGGAVAPVVLQDMIKSVTRNKNLDEATVDAAVAELLDPSVSSRHHDCCAAVGCPTGTCSAVLDAVGGRGKIGADLFRVLQSQASKSQAAVDAAIHAGNTVSKES